LRRGLPVAVVRSGWPCLRRGCAGPVLPAAPAAFARSGSPVCVGLARAPLRPRLLPLRLLRRVGSRRAARLPFPLSAPALWPRSRFARLPGPALFWSPSWASALLLLPGGLRLGGRGAWAWLSRFAAPAVCGPSASRSPASPRGCPTASGCVGGCAAWSARWASWSALPQIGFVCLGGSRLVSNPVVFSLCVRCGCGCRFFALSWVVRAAVLVGCPWCGRFWFVPTPRFLGAGRPVAWAAGSLPALPAPSVPAAPAPGRQLSLF